MLKVSRAPNHYVIQAAVESFISFVQVFDDVSFADPTGKLCIELEPSKMLRMDLRTLRLAEKRKWYACSPLFQVVQQGVLSVFNHLGVSDSESRALLDTPAEGERVRGWSRLLPHMLHIQGHPNGDVELRYFKRVSYAERRNGILHLGDTLESYPVKVEGHPWLCLLQNLAPMVKELVHIAHEIGE